jgi:hypothetical protein
LVLDRSDPDEGVDWLQRAEAKSTALRRRKRAGERQWRERRLTFERVAKGYRYFTLCPTDDGGDARSVERSILAFFKFGEGDSRNLSPQFRFYLNRRSQVLKFFSLGALGPSPWAPCFFEGQSFPLEVWGHLTSW